MIERLLSLKIKQAARQFPIVSVMGPRQSGKTTLVRNAFPKADYVSFEDPDVRRDMEQDPRGFLTSFSKTLILDEVQRIPHVFSYIQAIADEHGKNGKFIFTGSQNYLLFEKINQSLAGRVAILKLLPLSFQELQGTRAGSLETVLQKGFYPALWKNRVNVPLYYSSYVNTYIERDVRQIQNIGNLTAFQNFLRLCAGRAGQIINLTSLGNDCGISHNTAKAWLSILESSFIVHLLPPYFENYKKRVVKSPKLFFYDTGLLCYLLGIDNPKLILQHYLKGALMENFAFAELAKQSFNRLRFADMYYWRDKTGNEVDFLIPKAGTKYLVEVKAGKTVQSDFFKGLEYFKKIHRGKDHLKTFLAYNGPHEYIHNHNKVIQLMKVASIL